MSTITIYLESFSEIFRENPTDFYGMAVVDGKKYTILKYLGGYNIFRGFPFEAREES